MTRPSTGAPPRAVDPARITYAVSSGGRYAYDFTIPCIRQEHQGDLREDPAWVPPDKFNNDHLKAIGFASSNDRAVVPLLKDLGFLTGDGTPTQRYRDYRDHARARAIMAEALREAYPDLFVINENLTKGDREAVAGRFKSVHDSSDSVAEAQTRTFLSLLELADLKAQPSIQVASETAGTSAAQPLPPNSENATLAGIPLTYRFEIQLPPTKDVEVFRAIFRAMREELIG